MFLDSKVLDVAHREKFAKTVAQDYSDKLGWSVKVVTPQTISHSMQMCNKYNLNSLSFDTVYAILDRIKAQGVIVDHVFVDTLGKPETYKKQLSDRYPAYSFTVCSKADSLFPVVGAASIFAKVTRDFNLENWTPSGSSLSFDRNFGSGYPSGNHQINTKYDLLYSYFLFRSQYCQLVKEKYDKSFWVPGNCTVQLVKLFPNFGRIRLPCQLERPDNFI